MACARMLASIAPRSATHATFVKPWMRYCAILPRHAGQPAIGSPRASPRSSVSQALPGAQHEKLTTPSASLPVARDSPEGLVGLCSPRHPADTVDTDRNRMQSLPSCPERTTTDQASEVLARSTERGDPPVEYQQETQTESGVAVAPTQSHQGCWIVRDWNYAIRRNLDSWMEWLFSRGP